MNHHTTSEFWERHSRLPEASRRVADRHYDLLRVDPRHPSLRLLWFWIGPHDEYERLIADA